MTPFNLQSQSVVTTAEVDLQHQASGPPPDVEGASLALLRQPWLDLFTEVVAAPHAPDAAIEIATRLPMLLGGGRVAVGIVLPGGACRLVAVTGLATFDHHSTLTRAFEAAMEEVYWLGQSKNVPDDLPRNARQQLAKLAQVKQLAGQPLRHPHTGQTAAILLWLGDEDDPFGGDVRALLQAAERPLAIALAAVTRADRGGLSRLGDALRHLLTHRTGRVIAVAGFLAAVAFALPVPYRVTCDATVEPVTRRYVAAPFEAVLQSTRVRPGDVVRQGQVLAQLDGREIRWELASLDAEIRRAQKKRDAALAVRDAAASEIARLELEQWQQRRTLLESRSEQLTIKSPIDGVITVGDLQRAEGVRVTVGQTLFEVAPLDAMIVEIAMPEEEIGHFKVQKPVEIRVDAYPGQQWQGPIERIRPRSEIRDAKNVFIVEVPLENEDGALRPGMSCRARVTGPREPLAWCLFHRGFEAAARWVGW